MNADEKIWRYLKSAGRTESQEPPKYIREETWHDR